MWSAQWLWLWSSGTNNSAEEKEDMSRENTAVGRTERLSLYVSIAAATVGLCTFVWYRSFYPLSSRNDTAADCAESDGDEAGHKVAAQGLRAFDAEQQLPAQQDVALAVLERVQEPHEEGEDEETGPQQATAVPWSELLEEDDEPDVPIPVR
jgi:hypothetical protein